MSHAVNQADVSDLRNSYASNANANKYDRLQTIQPPNNTLTQSKNYTDKNSQMSSGNRKQKPSK